MLRHGVLIQAGIALNRYVFTLKRLLPFRLETATLKVLPLCADFALYTRFRILHYFRACPAVRAYRHFANRLCAEVKVWNAQLSQVVDSFDTDASTDIRESFMYDSL